MLEQQKRVLVVDDNVHLLRCLQRKLASDGYDVNVVQTGEEAVELLNQQSMPTLVLTDSVMPGMVQGQDLARHIKAINPKLPVVMMSGYVDPKGLSEADAQSIDVFVPKPFSLSDISDVLANAIRSASGLEFGSTDCVHVDLP